MLHNCLPPMPSRVFGRVAMMLALALALLASAATGALAQSASQITPHTFEPAPQPRGGEVVIPEATGPEAPKGSEQLFVLVGNVAIENGFPDLRQQEQVIAAEIIGKRVSVAELFAVARKLEQAYITAGYGLVRVALPAQRLKDGETVRFIVIDGYVERLDTSALPETIRGRVTKLLAPLVGRHGLRMSQIERALLLAGDLPGTALRSTLAPGSKPGAGVLVLDAIYQPVTGVASLDNTLSKKLGTYTASLGFDLNSVAGFGEQLYVRTAGRPGGGERLFTEEPRNRTIAAGLTIPLGMSGLSANFEVTDARTTPLADDTGIGTTSLFTRYSARLNYALIRARDVNVGVQGAFDLERERVRMITSVEVDTSLDRLRILRGGGNFSWFAPGDGLVSGRLTGSYGIGGRKAPTDSSATPLSRQGEDPVFQKLEMAMEYVQPLAAHLTTDLSFRGQTSFNRVMASAEQISLSGTTGLSPVAAGQVQGDSGYVVRGEAQFPFQTAFTLPAFGTVATAPSGPSSQSAPPNAGAEVTPYLFGATGTVRFAYPTAVESAVTHGEAYGLGLRLGAAPRASFRAVSFSLEYGCYTLGNTLGDGQRLTLAFNLSF